MTDVESVTRAGVARLLVLEQVQDVFGAEGGTPTAIAGYAADCARRAVSIFEQNFPADMPPRGVIDAAQALDRAAEPSAGYR